MKIVKRILIFLVVLIVVVLGISFFLPKGYKVTREIMVNTPSAENVFIQYADLKNWDKWSAWHAADPEAKYTYSEKTKGAGSTMSWDGKVVGKGTLTVVQFKENEFIKYKIVFHKGPMNFKSEGTIEQMPVDLGTRVVWNDYGNYGLVFRSMGLLVDMDKQMGPDFEKNLNGIKTEAEKLPVVVLPEINPEITEAPVVILAGIRLTCNIADIGTKLEESYRLIQQHLAKIKVKPEPVAPIAIYHKFTPPTTEMEAAIVVPNGTEGEGNIIVHPSYAGPVAVVKYYGAYDKMEPTYAAMKKWMKENGKEPNGASWESYVTDPKLEKDTAKWLTEIYWPIK